MAECVCAPDAVADVSQTSVPCGIVSKGMFIVSMVIGSDSVMTGERESLVLNSVGKSGDIVR